MRRSLLVFLIILSAPAFALTPPLEEEDLKREAELIVEGEMGAPVTCVGLIDQTDCWDRYKYFIPMTVTRVLKGESRAGAVLQLYFYHYDYGKSKCTGDQDASHLPGEKGLYYLRKLEDGVWHQVHWSGMKLSKKGSGELPPCEEESPADSGGIGGLIDRLGDANIPIELKRKIKDRIVAYGKEAIPALIASLDHPGVYEMRDIQNYYGLPPNIERPPPLFSAVKVGSECQEMLYRIITPVYRSPFEKPIKPVSTQMFLVKNWRRWWEKNRAKELEQIRNDLIPLVDRYWKKNGAVQRLD